jgi:HAE1 family hydrophobic/amphiphilic exporter-1
VQIDAVKQARAQVESNRRLVEQGVLAPIDIVAAETQVAIFEQDVYTAQERVTRAENILKTLLLPDRSAPLWSRALLPTTDVNLAPPGVQLEAAVAAALANRPEIEQVETTAEINRINTRFFRDQTKPQIDLIAGYTAVGLAGTQSMLTPNPITSGNLLLQERVNLLSQLAGLPALPPPAPLGTLPDNLIGGVNQSLSNLFGLDFTTARVGIRFSLPLGNRTAEANLGRSLAEGRRIDNQRDQLRQTIEADVRNLLQAVRSAQARLSAAAAARSSAELQFASEQRRLQGGLSTVFLVLERQTELISARGRELQAQTDLNRAIAEFRRATGETLQFHNISFSR